MESCILYRSGHIKHLRIHKTCWKCLLLFPIQSNPSVQLTIHEGAHVKVPAGMVVLLLGPTQFIPLTS